MNRTLRRHTTTFHFLTFNLHPSLLVSTFTTHPPHPATTPPPPPTSSFNTPSSQHITCLFNKHLTSLTSTNQHLTAIHLYNQIEFHKIITPCIITLTILITSFSHLGHVSLSFSLFGKILKRGYVLDTVTLNALPQGLCFNGHVLKALEFHDELVAKGFELNDV